MCIACDFVTIANRDGLGENKIIPLTLRQGSLTIVTTFYHPVSLAVSVLLSVAHPHLWKSPSV